MNNLEKIQELLRKEYENIGNTKKYDSTDRKINVQDIYIDTAAIEIIKSYNRRNNADIQSVLKAYLAPTTMEKLRTWLDGKDIADVKKEEQKEIERTISSTGISVDDKTKEKVQKEIKDKNVEENEENLRQVVLKAMYKSVLEEYYRLKQNVQETGWNSQIATGDISTTDKIGTELVLYEKYLKDIDDRYRAVAKVDIIRDDEEIRDFEESLVIHDEKNESAILNKNEDNLSQIMEVYEERNSIATEITNLSSKANLMDNQEFNKQMNALQNEYVKLSAKLYNLNPNPLEIEESIQQRNKDEKFRDREIGTRYQITHARGLGLKATSRIEENDIRVGENVENTNKQIVESDSEQKRSIDVIIESYEEAESRGNYEKAEELLRSLEQMAGIQIEEIEESNAGKVENQTPEEIQTNKEQQNKLFDPRLSATNDDNKVAEIEAAKENRKRRFNSVLEKLNIKRETTEVRAQEEYVPTLLNNKRGY